MVLFQSCKKFLCTPSPWRCCHTLINCPKEVLSRRTGQRPRTFLKTLINKWISGMFFLSLSWHFVKRNNFGHSNWAETKQVWSEETSDSEEKNVYVFLLLLLLILVSTIHLQAWECLEFPKGAGGRVCLQADDESEREGTLYDWQSKTLNVGEEDTWQHIVNVGVRWIC